MNNLKTREEFLNEGFYEWLHEKPSKNAAVRMLLGFLATIILSIYQGIAYASGKDHCIDIVIFLTILAFLNFPIFFYSWKKKFKNLYNMIRTKTMLPSTVKRIKLIEENIKEDPALRRKLALIKRELKIALESKNEQNVSKCMHDIYEMYLIFKKRIKYDKIFDMSDEEKALNKNLDVADPYGEEDWSDEEIKK